MELWDIFSADRMRTGKTMVRGEAFPEGAFHLVIHVCVFGSDGRMLIQQRQKDKDGWPGMWDVSVGGSAVAGEDAQMAATRELHEELGISYDFTGILPHFTINLNHIFDDVFLIEKDVSLNSLTLQEEEVQDARWATRDEIKKMIDDGTFIPYHASLIDLMFDLRKKYGMHRI